MWLLDNLRPITLLNTDYKILSGAIASRLKDGLSSIISETQSGFLKGRLIHNNIRLVLDLLDYSQIVQESGFILFLDFYKAFDSVEHHFILKTLYHFGFGNRFIDVIEMLHNEINSSVALGHGTCSRFEIKRGIRQGCSSSPLLFIMVAEMLSIKIKKEVKYLGIVISKDKTMTENLNIFNKIIDFDFMNDLLKLKWLKSFIMNRDSFWFIVPNMIFKKMGGIDFYAVTLNVAHYRLNFLLSISKLSSIGS